ncbi:MAG: CRTAC1 family protein [Halobacteriaceae archaeon]
MHRERSDGGRAAAPAWAVLLAVLLAGYAAYGGLALAAVAVDGALAGGGEVTSVPPWTVGETDRVGVSPGRTAGFAFARVDAGFDYRDAPGPGGGHMRVLSNAGVYAADYDRDGWTDLLAVGGERPVLFRNAGGSFQRADALPPLGPWAGAVRSALFVDYDVDGDPDLLLLADHRAPLLLENVGGTYERTATFDRPLAGSPFGATAADADGDGCPDVVVTQAGDWDRRLPMGFHNYSAPVNGDNGAPTVLYRGTCDGFERVPPERSGFRGARWTLAASFVDLTGDGLPDVHEANDINHDVVWVNEGDGTFRQVVLPERTNRNGMSSEVADVTGDGRLDVFVTNIHYPRWAMREIDAGLLAKARGNNLISAHGNGTFVLRGEQYGVNAGGWGWAAVIADFDNDGDEDLFHTTRTVEFDSRAAQFDPGQIRRLERRAEYRYPRVWSRTGPAHFTRVHAASSGFGPTNGRGVARLDYDRDGDLDLAVAVALPHDATPNATVPYALYENRERRRDAVQVRVLGRDGSLAGAYGATVSVAAANVTQTRLVHARSDFLSQDSRLVHVGIGNATSADVTVTWRGGASLSIGDVPADTRLVVTPEGVRNRVDLAG